MAVTILSMLLSAGCEVDRCFHGTGETARVQIETGYFDELNVEGLFHVILVEDTVNFIEFVGGEKVLEYVNVANTDSALWLYNTNGCFFFRDYEKIKAFVHYQYIGIMNIYEVCKVESIDSLAALRSMTVQSEMAELDLTINCERFSFYNHTTTGGTYSFSGKVDRCSIGGHYTGKFVMNDLIVRDFSINNSSISDMYVNAVERLKVRIHSSGNIYYSGSPYIEIDSITGSGQLIPWNTVK